MVLINAQLLADAEAQRNLILGIGTFALLAALITMSRALSRDVTRPLEGLAAVTRELVRGDYEKRAPASSIREIRELGNAVNHLAGELQSRLQELTHQANHDGLTGLPNRTVLVDRLTRAQERSGEVAVLFTDLDNFKLINDGLGHEMGDHLLIVVAERLSACRRSV